MFQHRFGDRDWFSALFFGQGFVSEVVRGQGRVSVMACLNYQFSTLIRGLGKDFNRESFSTSFGKEKGFQQYFGQGKVFNTSFGTREGFQH